MPCFPPWPAPLERGGGAIPWHSYIICWREQWLKQMLTLLLKHFNTCLKVDLREWMKLIKHAHKMIYIKEHRFSSVCQDLSKNRNREILFSYNYLI